MKKTGILLYTLFISLACSLEYDSSVRDELSETVPSSVLYGVEQIQVKNGTPRAAFSAAEARIWKEKENTELFDLQFLEFDESGEVITEGTADFLSINDNNDATIIGEISAYSKRNEASIKAEQLNWVDEKRELTSQGDGPVIISLDSGSILQGAGFTADFYSNTIEFTTAVEGSIATGSDSD